MRAKRRWTDESMARIIVYFLISPILGAKIFWCRRKGA